MHAARQAGGRLVAAAAAGRARARGPHVQMASWFSTMYLSRMRISRRRWPKLELRQTLGSGVG